ncbi:hypothetical protein SAY86_031312 [Trapa natans]|uniref:OTU domain-containing protein n=1 Tax=Trapa natans TaxID=22666 RepID=A0AAN7LSL9_TRANT|nr:hypothetical protein SAY86_031312 [Trapa natans]
MQAGGGVICGVSRATFIPSLLRRNYGGASTLRCFSAPDHAGFIRDVAVTQPPAHLPQLLSVLQARGDKLVSPGVKNGIIPLAIPLAEKSSGAITALLRWPTAPSGMEMPVVEVQRHGVWLLAKNVDQFIHRILVEEDVLSSAERSDDLFNASGHAGDKLYRKGDFSKSNVSSLDVYLLRKVGLFPDVLERKVMKHFESGDHVSALVTGEFYTKKENFPGFARPFVFNAEILLRVGRSIEAKDAARGALKSPWWTLGCKYQDVADIAEWEDEQIEYVKEKITEEGRQEDLKKGKPLEQILLDEAAFLLDLASVDGSWDDSVERIGECYNNAGLHDIARSCWFESPRVLSLSQREDAEPLHSSKTVVTMVQAKHNKSKPRKQPHQAKKYGKQTDMAQFRPQLDALGLKIVQVTADGNCFFRALADQLEGSEDEHGKYRSMVVQYIKKNRETFEPFIEDEVPFDEYCQTMENDGTWAGHMELQAASLVTRSNICIHQNMSPRWYIRNFEQPGYRMIHLSYHDEEHYNSVRLKEDPGDGPARPVAIKADSDLSSSSCQAKSELKKSKGGPGKNMVDAGSVKIVMAGSGCENAEKVEQILEQMAGDVDAAIEYLVAEQETEEISEEISLSNCPAETSYDDAVHGISEQSKEKNENDTIRQDSWTNSIKQTHKDNNMLPEDKKIPRNKACPCGSKKKYKSCCGSAARRPNIV